MAAIVGTKQLVVTLTFNLPPDVALAALPALVFNGGISISTGLASWGAGTVLEVRDLSGGVTGDAMQSTVR
jgi:hypothetical protein